MEIFWFDEDKGKRSKNAPITHTLTSQMMSTPTLLIKIVAPTR